MPLLSKVYERDIFNQLSEYMQKVWSLVSITFDYLNNLKQGTKPGFFFSSWCDIITGIPQGTIFRLATF